MRIVIAPDSLKGSIRALDAARALADGWRSVDPDAEIVLRPMADGGEGTLDAFLAAVPGARRRPVRVSAPAAGGASRRHAPDGAAPDGTLEAAWVLLPPSPGAPRGTGVVELASTAGIELAEGRLDPWRSSTRGFGEAIAAALDRGVSRLVLAVGSSASTDGGAGMLAALGARFVGVAGSRGPAARDLRLVRSVDLSALRPLPPAGATVLTDVTNPLLGPRGAAHVFGPQKGFAPDELAGVDDDLRHYAGLLPADPATPGAGAAGGTGFALLVWGARLVPGAAEVAELIGLAGAVASASVVVTGEGSFDAQSAAGKAPAHVAVLASRAGAPVALVAGRITPDADTSAFAASLSLTDLAGSAEAALADPARWLHAAGADLARAGHGA